MLKYFAYGSNMFTKRLRGVLFKIPPFEKESLDKAEGVREGYVEKQVQVLAGDQKIAAFTYVADPDQVDDSLRPFGWYRDLVLAGAREHNLPDAYVAHIAAEKISPDANKSREERRRRLLRHSKGKA
jgi:hypothetical protein